MLTDQIAQLMQKKDLTKTQCQEFVNSIITHVEPDQIAAILVLLHSKPESSDELYHLVIAMQKHMLAVQTDKNIIDIVGTGGDGANTVNISTAAAILAASLGVKVAKHGNRSVSSQCGSADVIAALGLPTHLSASQINQALQTHGFAFLSAPLFHPAMQKVKDIRRHLKVRTTFNLIGPLLNPAQPKHYLMGVYDEKLLDKFAEVLFKLNTQRSIVVSGNGVDEVTCIGPNKVIEIDATGKKNYLIDPKDYGFSYCKLSDLQGGDPQQNKALILDAFNGKPSAIADTIALNTAVALYLTGHTDSIAAAVPIAIQQLHNGKAIDFLANYKAHYQTDRVIHE